jgi:hypothetical protein
MAAPIAHLIADAGSTRPHACDRPGYDSIGHPGISLGYPGAKRRVPPRDNRWTRER